MLNLSYQPSVGPALEKHIELTLVNTYKELIFSQCSVQLKSSVQEKILDPRQKTKTL